jgi:hypothetical protein
MDRAKPVQEGVRVKLAGGTNWESLAAMTPEQIRNRDLFPTGFYPPPIRSIRRADSCFRTSSSMRSSIRRVSMLHEDCGIKIVG